MTELCLARGLNCYSYHNRTYGGTVMYDRVKTSVCKEYLWHYDSTSGYCSNIVSSKNVVMGSCNICGHFSKLVLSHFTNLIQILLCAL